MNEYDLHTYTYGPASGTAPQQLVILLHGLGADGRDLIGLAPPLAQVLPDAVFVSPDAPYPCDMAPVGRQWFSLQSRAPEAMLRGAQMAEPVLDHFITAQMEKYAIPANRTALVGFSQGTMMSLYAGPRFPETLAGILGYSGALLGEEDFGGDGILKPPVFLVHGEDDPVVPVAAWHHAAAALKDAGFTVDGFTTPGLQHNIDEKGLDAGAQFLLRVLR